MTGFSLKDDLFNPGTVGQLAGWFGATGAVDADALQARILARLPDLELKQRIAWIAECLCADLPGDLAAAAPILRGALPPRLDPTRTDDDFGAFILAPFGEVVVRLGLADAPDLSLDLLEEITQRFSMEMAIRPFLTRWSGRTLERMADWAGHDNYHVRRLVSEGTRPRLPWAPAVPLDPATPLPLLDRLHADPTRYVTRSVANHLNDVTKVAPDLALERLKDWREAGLQGPDELDWMTAHALRGLVKAGDGRALALLGFDPDAPVTVTRFAVPARARIGEALPMALTVEAAEDAAVLIDYVFWRRRANGDLTPKVHKWRKVQLRAGQPLELEKTHPLRGNATTYRLYPGPQRMSVQINGRIRAEADFDLTGA
ncbi:MAG: hypothetical protein ACWA5A_17385 [Marinibacterium sp.]